MLHLGLFLPALPALGQNFADQSPNWPEIGSWGQAWDQVEQAGKVEQAGLVKQAERVETPASPVQPVAAPAAPVPQSRTEEISPPSPAPERPRPPAPKLASQDLCYAPQEGARTSLAEFLIAAYTDNPVLKAQRASLRAMDERINIAQSGMRPSISVNGGIGHGIFTDPSYNEFETSRDFSQIGVFASQTLYDGGRTSAAVKEAEAYTLAGQAQLNRLEQEELAKAAAIYLDVLRTEAILRLNEQNISVLEAELEEAENRYQVQDTARTDLAQSQARLAMAHASKAKARAAVISARAAFARVAGFAAKALESVTPPGDLPGSLDQAMTLTRLHNPAIIAAQHAARAAKHSVDATMADLLPQVTLDANYDHRLSRKFDGSEDQDATLMLRVKVPLYSSGSTEARIRAQKHLAGQEQVQITRSQRRAEELTSKAWSDWTALKSRKAAQAAQVKAATTALMGNQLEKARGYRTKLGVLNAQLELFQAQTEACTSHYEEMAAAYRLLAATGVLGVERLDLGISSYDPKVNLKQTRNRWFGLDIMDND